MTPRFVLAALCAFALASSARAAEDPRFQSEIDSLARGWAHVNYEIKDARIEAAEAQKLAARADELARKYPDRAEPLAWEALILLSEADARHNMRSLELAKTARHLLERAAKIDPNAIGPGSIYANLGSLYAQVPGFPLGFGDAGKARVYFDKAVAANPSGLDANYFYGDFLYRQGDHAKAVQVLEKAMTAPSRPGRELADRGRKWETSVLLAKIRRRGKDPEGRLAEAADARNP
jgi:tetratricopeptide (TPR) repeat protein